MAIKCVGKSQISGTDSMWAISMLNRSCKFVCVVLLAALVGCGGGVERPATAPVSGTVMYNGQPISGATVSFWTEGAPRAATGVTGDDGTFQLSMFAANDGALPGVHTITVTKIDPGAAPPAQSMEAMLDDPTALASMGSANAGGGGKDAGPKSLIPAKYGDRNTTTLKETVSAEGENQFVLQLAD